MKKELKVTNCGNVNCQGGVINGKTPSVCKKCNPHQEDFKHSSVKSESGSELLFNEKGELVGEEVKQGYICPQTKVQCDDECCISAEDCHIESSKGVLSEERVPHSFCETLKKKLGIKKP